MKSVLLWSGVGLLVAGGIFAVLALATSQNPGQDNSDVTLSFPVGQEDHIKGNPEAMVALVEYGDFQCPGCASYFPLIAKIEEEFGDRVAIVYRHFPLKQIHQNAELAARASEAAALQGKFWEMHDMLFEKQNEWARKSDAEDIFTKYAISLELDEQQFRDDLDSNEVRDRVQSDLQAALADRLNGTPSFFLAGEKIPNPQTYEQFRQLIQTALAQHDDSSEPAE